MRDRLRIVIFTLLVTTAFFMAFPADISSANNPLTYYDPLAAAVLRSIRNDILQPGFLPFGMNVTLIGLTLTAPLELYLMASLVLGIAVSTPVIAYEIYKFIDPALYPHERRAIYPFIASFSALFTIGIIFGYKILTPFIIYGMLLFFPPLGAQTSISIEDFYQIVFVTTLASGFSFTLPVFFVLLAKFGVISTRVVTKNRKYIYAALYIATAILTPDGGIIGDLLLFIPMVVLLELAVLVARRYDKKPSEAQ